MSNPQHVAVAFLLEQDRVNNAQEEQALRAMFEKGHKPKKERQPKAPRVKKEEKDPVQVLKSAAPSWAILPPGSVGPAGFLKLLRNAKDRQESISAIHAYTGYDVAQDYGTQEYRAKAQAAREIKPIAYKPKAEVTVQGYVAGMPNNTLKFRQNLKAREVLAVEGMIQHAKVAETTADERDRVLHSGLAEVEQERLRVIQLDLRRADGERITLVG